MEASQIKEVVVHTSYWGHDGRHVYVTITGGGKRFEFVANRGVYQAKLMIEKVLTDHYDETYTILSDGEVVVPYTYRRLGD